MIFLFAVLLFATLILLAFVVVVVWKDTRPRPKVRKAPPPPSFRISDAAGTAVHEMGHTLSAWACTIVQRIDKVTIELSEDAAGTTSYFFTPLATADAHWCKLVIELSGLVAEIRSFKRIESGRSRRDLERAFALAREIEGTTPPWVTPPRETRLPFEKMFQACAPETEKVLQTAYRMAHAVLEAFGSRAWLVVSALLHHRTLTEKELTKILGARAFLRFSGVVKGATFILPEVER